MIDIFLKTNTPILDIASALSGFDSQCVLVRNGGPTEVWERGENGWIQTGYIGFNVLCPDHIELVAYTVSFDGGSSELVGDGLVLQLTDEEAVAFLAYMERFQYQLEDAIGCSIDVSGRSCALACFPLGEFKTMVDRNAIWGPKVVDWVIQAQKAGADEVGLVISNAKTNINDDKLKAAGAGCASAEELLDHLNSGAVDMDFFSHGEEFEFLGVKLTYMSESDEHSCTETAYLYGNDMTFKRDGIMEISYGSWTSTNWVGEWTAE